MCFAASSIVAKILRKRHDPDLLTMTGWQTLIGSIPLVLIAVLAGGGAPEWSQEFIWSLAYTTLIGTCGGALLWLFVLKKLPASIAGLGTMGTPVVGLLASWAVLGEQPTATEVAGMVAILAGSGRPVCGVVEDRHGAGRRRAAGLALPVRQRECGRKTVSTAGVRP